MLSVSITLQPACKAMKLPKCLTPLLCWIAAMSSQEVPLWHFEPQEQMTADGFLDLFEC